MTGGYRVVRRTGYEIWVGPGVKNLPVEEDEGGSAGVGSPTGPPPCECPCHLVVQPGLIPCPRCITS